MTVERVAQVRRGRTTWRLILPICAFDFLLNRVARQPPGALAERSGSERIAGVGGPGASNILLLGE